MSNPARYGGWQREKSGWFGELSGPGFVLVATALVTLLVPLHQRSLFTMAVFLPISALLLALAYGRVLGLTADEWALLAIRHQIATARRQHMFLSGIFAPVNRKTGAQPMDLPGPLARLRILDAPDGLSGRLGVAHDPASGTYTAVLRVTYPGLALVDPDRQESRVAGWAAVLRSLCTEDGAITRIGVHQRCLPDDGAALDAWTARNTAADAPREAVQALEELMHGAGPASAARETYVSLTLSASRARLAIKGAGGGQVGACAVLVREVLSIEQLLAGAGLTVVDRLTPRGVAAVIRTGYDPEEQLAVAARAAAAQDPAWQGTPPGVDPDLAGPAAAENSWGVYRHDGAWTVSYQIRGLPRSDVFATVLQPLLRPRVNARRCLTMVYEPLGPRVARRALSQERTKRETARQLRAKTGRMESEDERREVQTAREQDIARASGEGVVRMTVMLAVTVTDQEQLETACAELQADAAGAGLEIRRMWGAQDSGFAAAALPLALGLPDRRGMF
ncbi:SCO6880 family protein [Streptomyces sodiiphilus]